MRDEETFLEFLNRYIEEDSLIGDLARDAQVDESWPEDKAKLYQLRGYLKDCGATENAQKALTHVWTRYDVPNPRGGEA